MCIIFFVGKYPNAKVVRTLQNGAVIKNVEQFLQYMFEGQRGHVELMFMGSNRIPSVKSYSLFDPSWLKYATNRIEKLRVYENCYFGVCPRRESVDKHAEESLIVDVPFLWVDVDGKQINTSLDEHFKSIMNMEQKPTLVIMSGNGYHCYWKLKETYHVKDLDCKAYIKGILKGLSESVQGDSTFNLDRVLRVPFTFNMKDKSNLKKVRIVHFDPNLVYDVQNFESFKVDIDINELMGDEVKRQFRPMRLEDLDEHKKLVRMAKDRLYPHIRKIQWAENFPQMWIDIIVDNLANGIIDYPIDPPVEADIDMEDGMFILHMGEEFSRFPLGEDAMRVIKHMAKLRKKVATKDKIVVSELPFALRVKIMNGTLRGGRSELDYKVIYELRRMGYTPLAIRNLYEDERYKIGQKYRERYGSRHNYLMSIIKSVDKKMENA